MPNQQEPTTHWADAVADPVTEKPASTNSTPLIIYVLYVIGLMIPISAVVGVIAAHINKQGEASPVVLSHLNYQIRTFWWGLMWVAIGTIFSIVYIGYLFLLFWAIWTVYRIVKGLTLWNKSLPI